MTRPNRTDHIRLTSHPAPGAKPRFPIAWGAATARERGPIIGTVSRPADRNVIGTHGGSYALYRALAVSSGALNPIRRADLTNTQPAVAIGPFKQWTGARTIVSLDPWGHMVAEAFQPEIAEGIDIRPSIAVTRARLDLLEMQQAVAAGRLANDGVVVQPNGSVVGGEDRHRPGLVPARHRRALRHERDKSAPHPVRADGRHVPRARDQARPAGVPAARRRHHRLPLRRCRQARRPAHLHHLPRARRVQRLRRVRLRHLHLPALSRARHRGVRARRAGRRPRRHRLQPQGRPGARRGHQIPGLQRPQAPGRRRCGSRLLRAHGMRGRRAGCALPAADAGRHPLAGVRAHRSPRLHERHEIRRAARAGHRDRRARCRFPTSSCRRTRTWRSRPRRPPATTRRKSPSRRT